MTAPVYKTYGQEQLDAQYNLRARHPDHQAFFDAWDREGDRVTKALECRLDVRYGDGPLQTLDVFPASKPGAPVQMFIHGGYWQALDKSGARFPAEQVVAAGGAFVTINYDLAPAVTLDTIVAQCRTALEWCRDNAASFNGDPEQIFVAGHSAGGHLAANLAVQDWAGAVDGNTPLVRGACAISGVYDLEPLRLSYQQPVLKLDPESVRRNSPLYNLGRRAPPLIAAVGAGETNEFRRQNGMLATALRARGQSCEEYTLPGLHHFDILLELARADSELTRAGLTQMGLT